MVVVCKHCHFHLWQRGKHSCASLLLNNTYFFGSCGLLLYTFLAGGGTHLQFVSLTSAKQKQLHMCGVCGVQLHMCGHQLPLTLVTPLNPRLNKQSNPTATTNFVFRLIQCQPIYLHQQERLERKSDAPGKSEDRIQSRKQAAERRLFRPWHETQSYATRLNPSRAENEQKKNPSGKVFNVWCTFKNTKLFIIWT